MGYVKVGVECGYVGKNTRMQARYFGSKGTSWLSEKSLRAVRECLQSALSAISKYAIVTP